MAVSKNRRKNGKKKSMQNRRPASINAGAQGQLPVAPANTGVTAQPVAVDLSLEDTEVLWEQASGCMKNRDYNLAAKVYNRIIELSPERAKAHHELATALALTGNLPGARVAQSKAIRLAPDNVKYRANLCKIMIMQEDFIGAQEAIRQLMPDADEKRQEELRALLKICAERLADFNIPGVDPTGFDEAQDAVSNVSPNGPAEDITVNTDQAEELSGPSEQDLSDAQSEILQGLDALFDTTPESGADAYTQP